MFVDNFNYAFDVHNLNTISMSGYRKYDASLTENVMAAGDAVKDKPFSFKEFSYIAKGDIIRLVFQFLQ